MHVRGSLLTFVFLCLSALAGCVQNPPGVANSTGSQTPAGQTSDVNPYHPAPYVKIKHHEWSKNAVIYQINTRQFTREGTFRAAETQLPRLKELGVDILWL